MTTFAGASGTRSTSSRATVRTLASWPSGRKRSRSAAKGSQRTRGASVNLFVREDALAVGVLNRIGADVMRDSGYAGIAVYPFVNGVVFLEIA